MTLADEVRRETASGEARISIEISARCNLTCRMCSLEQFYQDKGLMQPATFDALLPELDGFDRLDLGTNAEALLNPQLEQYLAALHERIPRCEVTLVSNGVGLVPARAQALRELGVSEFSISLDAAAEPEFQRIRGTRLAPILAHLDALLACRDGARVNVNFTLQDGNEQELPALVELCAARGVDGLYVNRVEPYFQVIADNAPTFRGGVECRRMIQQAFARAAELGLELHAAADRPIRTGPCTFLFPSVTWKGEVVPCSALSYQRDYHDGTGWRSYPFRSYGNVHRTTLLEIWRRPEYAGFRRQVLADGDPTPCGDCLRRKGIICPTPAADRYWQAAPAEKQ